MLNSHSEIFIAEKNFSNDLDFEKLSAPSDIFLMYVKYTSRFLKTFLITIKNKNTLNSL